MAAPDWVRSAAPAIAPAIIKLLCGTLKIRWLGAEPTDPPVELRTPFIYAFWHQRLLLFSYTHRFHGIPILISRHADGELIARIAERLGFRTVRGSSTRGGAAGLLAMTRLGAVDMAITPDGPRGPRHRVKPGVIFLAAQTGYPILPGTVSYDRFWSFKSWDRFILPKPFARALVRGGRPFCVPRAALTNPEPYRRRLEAEMRDLTYETDRRFEELYRKARPRAPQFLRTRTTLST